MIAFRRSHPNLQRQQFFNGETDAAGKPDVEWHGCSLDEPGWKDPDSHVLAFTLWGQERDNDLHVMLNMDMQDLDFAVPTAQGEQKWYVAVDTALDQENARWIVGEAKADRMVGKAEMTASGA